MSPSLICSRSGSIALDVRLSRLDRQGLVHHRAEREVVDATGVDAGNRERAALPAALDRLAEHVGPVVLQPHPLFDPVGGGAETGPVGLGADRVDAAVGPPAAGHLHQPVVDVLLLVVDRLRVAVLPRHLEALGDPVDGDDPVGAEHPGALDGELPDRPAAPDGDGVVLLDVGVLRGHVAGREDVREEEHLLVGEPGVDRDGTDVGVRNPQVLRLRARVPAREVRVAEQPRGDCPIIFRAISAFGFELSQREYSSFSQNQHDPQLIVNGTTTRSPSSNVSTSLPTSITSPVGSWPITSSARIEGISSLYRCRSEPRIAVAVTSIIASFGLTISGRGTFSTRMSSFPCQVSALIVGASSQQIRLSPTGRVPVERRDLPRLGETLEPPQHVAGERPRDDVQPLQRRVPERPARRIEVE